jgi:hypothetical protein
MEDEDEMDDKKKSMKEALHPNQQKIDVVDDEKIDAKDFAKLRQMKKMKEEAEQIAELSKKTTGSYLKKATQDYANRHGDEGENQGWDDARGDSAWDDSPNEDDREEHEKEREANTKKMGDRNRGINRAIKKLTKEAVNVLMKDKDSTALRYPKGHSAHGDAHRAATAKAAKTARAAGSLKGSDRSTWKRPGQSVTSGGVSAARPAKPLGEEEAVADKVRTRGSVKVFSKKKLPGSDKSSMNEVAMPQNAADWQALITHQIKTTGHPVATDAQFRATNGKDETKIASLEPGKDKLHYAAAQGGTVKR